MDLEPQPINIVTTIIGVLIAIAPWRMAAYADVPTSYKVMLSVCIVPISYIIGSILADK